MDFTKYFYSQKNHVQWGTQLGMLFISIVYGVQIISVQWFGDAIIDFDTATELGLRDLHQFVLPAAPVICVYFHVHRAPGFTGSGVNQFCTLLECSASSAENREVLTFQPDKPHISIYLSRIDASTSSSKMVQSVLDGILIYNNLERGEFEERKIQDND